MMGERKPTAQVPAIYGLAPNTGSKQYQVFNLPYVHREPTVTFTQSSAHPSVETVFPFNLAVKGTKAQRG